MKIASVVVLVSIFGISSPLSATDEGEIEKIQIEITKTAVSLDSKVVCSLDEFEASIASYLKSARVHVRVGPDVATAKFLQLVEILRSIGFEDVRSTGVGDPGWALYPPSHDVDVFQCDASRRDGTDDG